MNKQAERHLARAENYLGKGDEWYGKAADEVIAAKKADPTLGNREIGAWFDRSERWIRDLVAWRTSASTSPTPYAGTGRPHQDRVAAKKVLMEAPLEQVERIVSELPKERAAAIGAAAGNRYMQVRQREDERERRLTPAERQEREAVKAETTTEVARMMSGFSALAIANHIEIATEKLKEMIEAHAASAEAMAQIEKAHDEFLAEYRVARAMAGLDPDREEVS